MSDKSAFPFPPGSLEHSAYATGNPEQGGEGGMTIRQRLWADFAAAALMGVMVGNIGSIHGVSGNLTEVDLSKAAVTIANAMMAEIERQAKED